MEDDSVTVFGTKIYQDSVSFCLAEEEAASTSEPSMSERRASRSKTSALSMPEEPVYLPITFINVIIIIRFDVGDSDDDG